MELNTRLKLTVVTLVALLLGSISLWWYASRALVTEQELQAPSANIRNANPNTSGQALSVPPEPHTARALAAAQQVANRERTTSELSSQMWQESVTDTIAPEEEPPQGIPTSGLSPEEAREMYQLLGQTFQWMKERLELGRDLIAEYDQTVAKGQRTFEYDKAHFTQIYDIGKSQIESMKDIGLLIPGATEVREVEQLGHRIHEYVMHRDVIESVLGPMPSEVEMAFLPVHKFAEMMSEAQFQQFLVDLERSYLPLDAR